MDEEEVLDWLTDPENMESMDHIERVNRKMFHRILQRSDFLAAFFCNSVNSELIGNSRNVTQKYFEFFLRLKFQNIQIATWIASNATRC